MRPTAIVALALLAGACGGAAPGPASLDTRHDACAACRMAVSSRRFASQLVAPGEEPRFFDDLGCLAEYVRSQRSLPAGATAYVADHRTGEWIPAAAAVLTRVSGLETPMGSHVVAHANVASRDADPDARGGTPVSPNTFFDGLPGGGAR